MTSNRARTSALKYDPDCANAAADPPGPPGSPNRTPMRRAGSDALSRETARSTEGPCGSAQSSGTRTVPQSAAGASGHGDQSIPGAFQDTSASATAVPVSIAALVRTAPSTRKIGRTVSPLRCTEIRPARFWRVDHELRKDSGCGFPSTSVLLTSRTTDSASRDWFGFNS